ncbi:MAG: hypothetical protein KY467_00025 [Gemmatimonadetes bacterium]|nr:hypothetical protein [Gemmatimonadota bacterium]
MIHRSLLPVCALALLAACDSPVDPSKPGTFTVQFIGVPADAESFTPRAVTGGRVVGAATDGTSTWAVEWQDGVFRRLLPAAPAGCHTDPLAARGRFTVGQVLCTASGEAAGQPVDAYGWVAGESGARLFAEPYAFVAVNADGAVAGTINPPAHFPGAQPRAFVRTAAGVQVLLPDGAAGSEAVGITDAGQVVVTASYACLADDEDCVHSRVMVWTNGAWTELRIPRSPVRVVAGAVSPGGHVAVYAFGEADQVFVYDLRRRDLDPLPVIPGTRVVLVSANARGQVIGTGVRTETSRRPTSYGIVWGAERQYDLTERLTGSSRWHVSSALATDDEGRIAGTGTNLETGEEGAILLVPSNL